MALPASGEISMAQVNTELERASNYANANLNESAIRTLFAKPSGAISMDDGHGKSNTYSGSLTVAGANGYLDNASILYGDWRGFAQTGVMNSRWGGGQSSPACGSISPSSVYGAAIAAIVYVNYEDTETPESFKAFEVHLVGNRAYNFFSSITLNSVTFNTSQTSGQGAPYTYSHSTLGTCTVWSWVVTIAAADALPGSSYTVTIPQ
jgi:hypothetical protein